MRPGLCPLVLTLAATAHSAMAQAPASAGEELFEKKIRPVLVAKCFACHSSTLKSPMGAFTMDTKAPESALSLLPSRGLSSAPAPCSVSTRAS